AGLYSVRQHISAYSHQYQRQNNKRRERQPVDHFSPLHLTLFFCFSSLQHPEKPFLIFFIRMNFRKSFLCVSLFSPCLCISAHMFPLYSISALGSALGKLLFCPTIITNRLLFV